MPNYDVDYPFVRENADIVAVLSHCQVELSGDGDQRKGCCPFHQDEKPSLSVNVRKNVFNCHACGNSGNVIRLVQEIDPELKNPRRAALQIAKLSGIPAKPDGEAIETANTAPAANGTVKKAAPVETLNGADSEAKQDDGEAYNRPLSFTLQLAPVEPGESSPANQFVEDHGIPYERLTELGIGIGQRGSMEKRLAIPICNAFKEIVAYCGRDVGLLEGENEPKYKFPPKFDKELELYGWDAAQHFERVVLVPSMLSVIKHGGEAAKSKSGGFGVVSTMGTSISEEQVDLLLTSSPEVIVCFAGDADSEAASREVAAKVAEAGLWVTILNCNRNRKPHHYDIDVFCEALGGV